MLRNCFFGRKSLIFVSGILYLLFLVSVAGAENERTVALVMKALSNPFFFKMEVGAKKYAQRENIPLEVFGVERETDIVRQIGIVENLISRGYGAIVIAPADSKKLVPICAKALRKNIIVINIDNPLHRKTMDQHGISIPFVGSDNRAGAGMVGNYVRKKLKGRGKVMVIEGIRGVENADLRKEGFIGEVTKNSTVKVVAAESANWHADEAFSLSTRLLRSHDSIDAIFCANDKMALGVLQALALMDFKEKILLAGYDNIESVRDEIRSGRIQATVEQHPELMGQFGVRMAWEALNGEKIPDYQATPLDLITGETFNKTIGLSISNLRNPFFSALCTGVREAANLFGARLIIADAGNSEARQLTDVYDLLKRKVDLLIVNPTNTETITPAIEMANRENIPIITVDRKVSEGQILCHIGSDNVQGGKTAAKILARRLKGKGKVIEIEGIPGTSAAHERGMGFNEAIREYPAIEVTARTTADFDRKTASEVMKQLLRKNIDFDAVFAHNDSMILGVMDALADHKDRGYRVLIGFDGIPKAVKAVREGRLSATIAQKPEAMGRLAVENAVRFFRGENLFDTMTVELKVIEKK